MVYGVHSIIISLGSQVSEFAETFQAQKFNNTRTKRVNITGRKVLLWYLVLQHNEY